MKPIGAHSWTFPVVSCHAVAFVFDGLFVMKRGEDAIGFSSCRSLRSGFCHEAVVV